MSVSPIIKRSFPPVVDIDVRLLVLGSLPGEKSLAQRQYYANPRNQFWRLIGQVIDADLVPLAYEARLASLRAARIGLWDSVGSASREGSLDASIRGHKANELRALVENLPDLRAVAFNGGTAARIGEQALGPVGSFDRIPLPSSSPAFTRPFDRKLEAWLRLRRYL
jgi:hypoxanthine-DNA glycosylase